jgi:hypothetical protein
MGKIKILVSILFMVALPQGLRAVGWEWQFSLGPWTLEPWTSPVAREAEKMVNEEAGRLLAPLLSEFTFISFSPRIKVSSSGYFFSAGCWRRLAAGRFSLGISASYLDFSLPFTLEDERDIYFQNIPIAHIQTSGQGKIDLRTIMLAGHGRWRLLRSGRTDLYTGLGLTLLKFSGKLHLPLVARVDSLLGAIELRKTEDKTLAELRVENDDIPTWILSPSLTVSLHYRLGNKSRLFVEMNLSQGTFLAAGLAFGR